mmetsp:Transcript_68394/g.154878  ORF Transcript_68394/g.154878 Transcript_68394/m.154878 type:complete len:193 (+) Transcript_68394:40-618(+)
MASLTATQQAAGRYFSFVLAGHGVLTALCAALGGFGLLGAAGCLSLALVSGFLTRQQQARSAGVGAKLGVLHLLVTLGVSGYRLTRCLTGGMTCDHLVANSAAALCTILSIGLAVYYFRWTSFRARETGKKRLASFAKGGSIDLDKLKAMAKPSSKYPSEEAKLKEEKRKEDNAKLLEGLKQRQLPQSAPEG